MGRFNQTELRPVALACGVLLMLGWFTVTMAMLHDDPAPANSDFTQQRVPVLMYHHLLPQADIKGLFADNNVVVSVEQFQEDVRTLQEQGYQTVSLRQLQDFVQHGTELPAKSVMITFDDGYLSNKIYAMPILEQAGYTAVIFALTGWMEEHPQTFDAAGLQYLSWPEIQEMGRVFQFASHTDNLHSLSWNGKGKLTTVSQDELAVDIVRSVKKLRGTTFFSYPYGHYTDTARQVLQQHNISLAFTVEPADVQVGDDPLMLGRWDMYRYTIDEVLQQQK